MGQIFYSTVYDVKTRECISYEADKFHANCFSFSGAVKSAHYLLKDFAKRVMWYGIYSFDKDFSKRFVTEEKLLGVSIREGWDIIKSRFGDYENEPFADKLRFIGENHETWNHRDDVWDKALDYYKSNNRSVRYSGYLLNHSKKEAVDLRKYFEKSVSFTNTGDMYLIDPIPPLTETGGGTEMALFDGCAVENTEHLIGTWCGDLLQIDKQLPEGYTVIDCCFAEVWGKAQYCRETFGLDKENFILKNKEGDRYEATKYNPFTREMKRCEPFNIQEIEKEDGIYFKSVL